MRKPPTRIYVRNINVVGHLPILGMTVCMYVRMHAFKYLSGINVKRDISTDISKYVISLCVCMYMCGICS